MKVGILTYYGVHNHGALLQANALKSVLEAQGVEVEFLKFQRNYDYIPVGLEKKYQFGIKSIPFFIKYMFKKGIGNIFYNFRKNRTLNIFRRTLPINVRYSDYNGDAVVIGSDEVFSFEVGINPFFFGHGICVKNIFSYAGCFGPTKLDFLKERNLEDLVSSGLKTMSHIGVRDKNSKEIADTYINEKAVLVCDPVILYGYQKEILEFTPKKKNYILIYSYDKNMNESFEVEKIKEYARKKNVKIFSVGYYHKWCDKNINASPIELLGWVKNAAMVITDTFHGSVLSLICNTQFTVKLRGNENKLKFLLEEYDLTSRILQDFTELEKMDNLKIDFCIVNDKIKLKRENSLAFLKEALLLEGNHD